MDKFQQDVLAIVPSPSDLQLVEWIETYYTRTEEYDRSVCSGTGIDGAMPVDSRERRLVSTHASYAYRSLLDHARSIGFDSRDVQEGMRMYQLRHRGG